ncbi:MAG: VWA domain-containing protein [Lachnospiraceae bacterium]|nr:VWA domain-containing protein [Lachnospiraceae bacterium]
MLTLSICLNTINMDVYAIEEAGEIQSEQDDNNEQTIKDDIDNDTIADNAIGTDNDTIADSEIDSDNDTIADNVTDIDNDTITEKADEWNDITKESVYKGENFEVKFMLTDYWNDGYNAKIMIENIGKTIIENWSLEFDYNGTISNIWNATISKEENGNYIIKNNVWNQDIEVGKSVEFGISGQENFKGFPQKYNLLGGSTTVDEEKYSITYNLDSDWDDGFTGSISITNNMSYAIEEWGLEFDYDRQITDIWNASIESHDGNHYVIKNAGHNSNIEAGKIVSFGFKGTGGISDNKPYNYKMTSISLPVSEDSTEIDENLDTDNDGIPDYLEDYFGTDKYKKDTDGDGMSDYIEIFLIDLNPTAIDTDGNGVNDGDEDADADGLSNLYEIEIGTNLIKADSDNDGLSDSEEINLYGTDPLKYDTDEDGVSDGKEVELGTNPLVAEEVFLVTASADDEYNEDTVDVSVEVSLSGEQVESLSVERYKDEFLFPETMPGYIGGAYDFRVDGNFEQATLKFEFDKNLLADSSFDPVIYYFNEEDQLLEELDTTIDGNVATATTSHFSKYILVNRDVYEDECKWEDVWSTGNYSDIEVVFVIDYTEAMLSKDSTNQRLVIARNILDKLPENSKLGLVRYEGYSIGSGTIINKTEMKRLLADDYWTPRGKNAYMYEALATALKLFKSTNESTLRIIVLLSDGSARDAILHYPVIATANEQNVKIYTVGLGESTTYFTSYLKPLANNTGGEFYLASESEKLMSVFTNMNKKIDIETDSDNDGIPDYYEENMVMFNGVKITLDKNNPDSDGDGLLDGEEVVELNYKYNEDKTKVIVTGKMISNPLETDSDYDGKTDSVDEAPLNNRFSGTLSSTYPTDHINSNIAFNMDYRWFFNDSTVYNKDLSIASSLFAAAAYHTQSLSIKDSTKNDTTAGESITQVMDYFGFNNTQAITLKEKGYSDHLSEVGLGYRTVIYNGESKNIVAVIVRGTDGSIAEWSSNFDIGNKNEFDSEPDWKRVDNHKGFDIAANRILQIVSEYVKENAIDTRNCVYWVTGHSRGAAIANIIGSEYRHSMNTAFTYTYAAPNTTMGYSYGGFYQSIFNIINTDDFVPYLPMSAWGYKRYGKTVSVSIAQNYEKEWQDLTDIDDYNPDTFGLQDTVSKLGYIISSGDAREEAYKFTCGCHGDGSIDTITVTNYGISEESRDKAIAKIPDNARPYCIITTYDGNWNFDNCQTPAYFMQLLAATSSNYISKLQFVLELNVAQRYENAKAALVKTTLGGIKHPHYTESYYLLANKINGGFR